MISKRKIKSFFLRHKVASIVVGVAFLAAISLILYNFYSLGRASFEVPTFVKVKSKETKVQAPLSGLLVDPALVTRKPLAVVIENHPDARPQSGYPAADLVYETIAEGGITRTLAIFQSQNATEIGPVRSARDYFIDWLVEYNAAFIHVGGNADALAEIRAKRIPDINQFYYGGYFWRSTSRYAPHNVYTTTDKLYSALKQANISLTAEVPSLSFKKDLPEAERSASQTITIDFSSPQFVASYVYSPKSNSYLRSIGGIVHKDKVTGGQLVVKNIIVQYETMSPGISSAGEQKTNIITTGQGKAIVFVDGKAIAATWQKVSKSAKTKYLDSLGKEIQLNPGQTWFEIVPQTARVTYQ